MKQVLVAFNFRHNRLGDNAGFVRMLNEGLTKDGIEAVQGALKEFTYVIRTDDVTVSDDGGGDIASYDLVLFRLWAKEAERATAAAIYLHHKGVNFYDREVLYANRNSKLTEMMDLALAGITIPRTIMCSPARLAELCRTKLAFPCIVKDIYGLKGRLNFLVPDEARLQTIAADNPAVRFIGQEYVPNSGDYRLLVFGDRVRLAIYRTRSDDNTHLNNVSQGGSSKLVSPDELPDPVLDMALRAARAVRREVAGVDIMVHRDSGQAYVLEVNSQPEILTVFGDEKIAGLTAFIKDYIAK